MHSSMRAVSCAPHPALAPLSPRVVGPITAHLRNAHHTREDAGGGGSYAAPVAVVVRPRASQQCLRELCACRRAQHHFRLRCVGHGRSSVENGHGSGGTVPTPKQRILYDLCLIRRRRSGRIRAHERQEDVLGSVGPRVVQGRPTDFVLGLSGVGEALLALAPAPPQQEPAPAPPQRGAPPRARLLRCRIEMRPISLLDRS